MAANQAVPPDPASSPWLAIAAPVGKIATYLLVGACFLQLFAPLAFLSNFRDRADPNGPGGPLILFLSDPVRLLALGDFVSILGVVILACAVFLILFGLIRADKRVRIDAFLLGLLVFACLVAWIPVMAYAQGRATGSLSDLDAAAATGGWGIASLLLLGASLAYLFFTVRLENGTKGLKLGSFKWPIYAAVNVLGSAALAGFFASGGSNMDAFSMGLALKVTVVPLLGVMAYADLRDRFPAWARVALHGAPPTAKAVASPVRIAAIPMAIARPVPLPPPTVAHAAPPLARVTAKPVGARTVELPLPPPPDD